MAALVAVIGAGSAAADGVKPTLTKSVDANGDAVFSDTENVPKTVSYPWTVTYQLTVSAGSFNHTITTITDSTTSNIGGCQALVGTVVPANQTVSCTYQETLPQAGASPFVNTAMLNYDSSGDVLSNTATVNFPGMTLQKSSTTTSVTASGQVVPYSYLVTNTGTSVLTGISLVDTNTDAPPSCPATTLAVGGSMMCTGQHTVTLAEFLAGGTLVNVATASSNEAPDATATLSIPIVRTGGGTGALTIGFWQNKNGQGIISGGATVAGVCKSGTWLRQYAPFQGLGATATCAQVAAYVTTIIKSASCGGSTCNAMLKAQMLATALNVYFSDPALGGNAINAGTPIGGVTIVLTMVCTDIPTCSTFVDVSSAFGGAASLTVSQMLAFAASMSNVGGSIWYGNVKATQVLAKDAFDAINNQVAFTL
jgi:hypothetical protein